MPNSTLDTDLIHDLHLLLVEKLCRTRHSDGSPLSSFCLASKSAFESLIELAQSKKVVLRFNESKILLDYVQSVNEEGNVTYMNLPNECMARVCRKWVEKVVVKFKCRKNLVEVLPMLLECSNMTSLNFLYAWNIVLDMRKELPKVLSKLQVLETDTATLQKLDFVQFRNVTDLIIRDKRLDNLRRINFTKSMFPKLDLFCLAVKNMTLSGIKYLYEACEILPLCTVTIVLDASVQYLDTTYVRHMQLLFSLFVKVPDAFLLVMVKRKTQNLYLEQLDLEISKVSTTNTNVIFVDNDAVVTDTGSVSFEQAAPISIEVLNYPECKGSLRVCYSAIDPSIVDSSMHCGPDHCLFEMDLTKLKSQMASVKQVDRDVVFTMNEDSDFACEPKVDNNVHSYKVTHLPKGCKLKFLNAKKPKHVKSGHSTELIIAIVGVLVVGALIIVFIFATYYYCRRKHPKTETEVTKTLGRPVSKPLKSAPRTSRSPLTDPKSYVKSSLPISLDGQSPTAVSLRATSDGTSQLSSNIPTVSPPNIGSTQTSPETAPDMVPTPVTSSLITTVKEGDELSVSMKHSYLYVNNNNN